MFRIYLTNGKGCFEYAHPDRESAVQWYRALYHTVKAKVRAEPDGQIIQSYVLGGDVEPRDAPAVQEMAKVFTTPVLKVQKQLDTCLGCGELYVDPEHEYCEECLRKRAYPEAWAEKDLVGILDARVPACIECGAQSDLDSDGLCIICAYNEGENPIDFIGEITGEVYPSTILAATVAA